MEATKLKTWIQNSKVPRQRAALYTLMMLPSLSAKDKSWLSPLLFDPPLSPFAPHLPPLIIAYAEAGGPLAVAQIQKVFLPLKASASATFGAMSGFEFLGTEARDPEVRGAARLVIQKELEVPVRGVFAVPILASWRDFSVASKVEEIANDEGDTPWVVSACIRYFRGFDNPESRVSLKRLQKRYPKIYENARDPYPQKS